MCGTNNTGWLIVLRVTIVLADCIAWHLEGFSILGDRLFGVGVDLHPESEESYVTPFVV